MPKRFSLHPAGLLLLCSSFILLHSSFNNGAGEWKFDPAQAKVHFEIPGYKKQGSFTGLNGTFIFDPAFPEQTTIDAEIAVATVKTGHHLLDWHLQRKGYFDAEVFPRISFHSSSAIRTDTCFYTDGQLTMKGVTKATRLQFRVRVDGSKAEFNGKMEVSAGDFGVGRKDKKGKDRVFITIGVPLSR